jgi:hypothetical protein
LSHRGTIFLLSFECKGQQINQRFDFKGFFNELIDPGAQGVGKDVIIAVGCDQKSDRIRLGNGGQLEKFQTVDTLILHSLHSFFSNLPHLQSPSLFFKGQLKRVSNKLIVIEQQSFDVF